MRVTIVKFGGSLAQTPHCAAWLEALAAWRGPLVIVPGGGPFANAVRAAQAILRFDDAVAHRMALLAMEQFAVALAALSSDYALAASRDELDSTLLKGQIPVWLPSRMVLAAREVPQSWDMTSDSLAAWLAADYGAGRLLLIKSRDPEPAVSVKALAENNLVDPLFPHYAAHSGAEVWLAGPASLPDAARILQRGDMPGIKLVLP